MTIAIKPSEPAHAAPGSAFAHVHEQVYQSKGTQCQSQHGCNEGVNGGNGKRSHGRRDPDAPIPAPDEGDGQGENNRQHGHGNHELVGVDAFKIEQTDIVTANKWRGSVNQQLDSGGQEAEAAAAVSRRLAQGIGGENAPRGPTSLLTRRPTACLVQ